VNVNGGVLSEVARDERYGILSGVCAVLVSLLVSLPLTAAGASASCTVAGRSHRGKRDEVDDVERDVVGVPREEAVRSGRRKNKASSLIGT
jgi:hypothetical protein